MRNHLITCGVLTLCLTGLGFTGAASAARGGNNACPVDLVPAAEGQELDTEFGPGSSEITKCLDKRHQVKLVVQINQAPPYALHNIQNVIDDYEYTNGMVPGRDYEIAAIVHSAGGLTVVQNSRLDTLAVNNDNDPDNDIHNPGETQVVRLMEQGVQFYFCQNTTRGYIAKGILSPGDATAELIPGVQYVSAGISALADFQSRGWQYVQP
jgi:intracellular sulfur oxidation DsrE/DsrF family protein